MANLARTVKYVFTEEGSGALGFSFTGLDNEAVTPNTLLWTLTDTDGTVINSREDVSVTPGSTTWVVLSGNDLSVSGADDVVRVLTIKGTYNTVLGGSVYTNVPYTYEERFYVKQLIPIP